MSLEINKIAAAVLVAGLVGMVTGKVTNILYYGTPHGAEHAHEEKRGYTIETSEVADTGGTVQAEEKPVDINELLATADAARGESLTKPCVTCHTFEKGGPNKVGPNLWGVVGATKGHVSSFAYSDAMKAKGGNWDPQSLSEFLTKPAKFIPGTKMSFAGIKKPEDRAAVIKYLESLK